MDFIDLKSDGGAPSRASDDKAKSCVAICSQSKNETASFCADILRELSQPQNAPESAQAIEDSKALLIFATITLDAVHTAWHDFYIHSICCVLFARRKKIQNISPNTPKVQKLRFLIFQKL